jgi:hypothetical protein
MGRMRKRHSFFVYRQYRLWPAGPSASVAERTMAALAHQPTAGEEQP